MTLGKKVAIIFPPSNIVGEIVLKQKNWSLIIFEILLVILVIGFWGCGGSSGGGMGSSIIGITTTQVFTPEDAVKILPFSSSLQQGETTAIAILVTDENGNPKDAASVSVFSKLGATWESTTGNTSKGWFYSKYTAGTVTGIDTIAAVSHGSSSTADLQILQKTVATPTLQMYLGNPSTPPAVPVNVSIYSSQVGQPTSDGTVVFSSNGTGNFKDITGTFSKGWFSTTFTPGTDTGSMLLSASFLGVTTSAALNVVNATPPTRLFTVRAHPESIFTGQSSVVLVQVTDANGYPADANVVLSSNMAGTFAQSSGSSKDGIYSTTYQAGTDVGTVTISALYFDKIATTSIVINKPKISVTLATAANKAQINSNKNPVSVLVTKIPATITPKHFGSMVFHQMTQANN